MSDAPMLTRYWIRKFVGMFFIALVALFLVERMRGGADYLSVVLWSFVAASFAASLSTYWAYKKSCGLPPRV